VIGCENTELTITCPVNTKINIILAIYGRTDSTICTTNPKALEAVAQFGNNIFDNTSCSGDVASTVVPECNIDNECIIEVTNLKLGERCPGTYKYLRVEYTCVL